MAKFTIIGDVHGQLTRYLDIIACSDYSIQLGDFCINFSEKELPFCHANRHKFIRGNHDNPELAKSHPAYLGDYGIWNGIFFLSGTNSYDACVRTIGVNLWENEELSLGELAKAIELYQEFKPSFVVTHDCPQMLVEKFGIRNEGSRTKTRAALQVMFESWKPDFWFFGHHHRSMSLMVKTCRFTCLNILESFTFEWFHNNQTANNIFPFINRKTINGKSTA